MMRPDHVEYALRSGVGAGGRSARSCVAYSSRKLSSADDTCSERSTSCSRGKQARVIVRQKSSSSPSIASCHPLQTARAACGHAAASATATTTSEGSDIENSGTTFFWDRSSSVR
eukprot:2820172-Prymnesium_polylepis.2